MSEAGDTMKHINADPNHLETSYVCILRLAAKEFRNNAKHALNSNMNRLGFFFSHHG
jgi:hypothetical protein